MLELGPNINKEDVAVRITTDEGTTDYPRGTFESPYYHIFRTPSDDQYYASVFHTDPVTKETVEKLHVVIPVYKMGFQGRLVESESSRQMNIKNSSVTTTPNFSNDSSSNTNGSKTTGTKTDSIGSFKPATGSPEGNSTVTDIPDLSDLYDDPSKDGNSKGGIGAEGSSETNEKTGEEIPSPNGKSSLDAASPEEVNLVEQQNQAGAGFPAEKSAKNSGKVKEKRPVSSIKVASPKGQSSCDGSSGAAGQSRAFGKQSSTGKGTGNSSSVIGFSNESSSSSGSGSPDSYSETGVTTDEVRNNQLDVDRTLSLCLFNTEKKINQSFDFSSTTTPVAQKIEKNTELFISVDIGKKVRRETVRVVIFDGKDKVEVPLDSVTNNILDHNFKQATPEAYVWVYGNTDSEPFSYKVTIPVSD